MEAKEEKIEGAQWWKRARNKSIWSVRSIKWNWEAVKRNDEVVIMKRGDYMIHILLEKAW